MFVTDDAALAETARLMRSHCMTAQTLDRHMGHAWGYDVVGVGLNYRMTEIEAALGLVQLAKLPETTRMRRRLVEMYRRALEKVSGVDTPFKGFETGGWQFNGTSAYHLMPILLPPGIGQRDAAERLATQGVQTSVHYRPLHTLTSLRRSVTRDATVSLTRLDSVAPRLMTLPLWPGMPNDLISEVSDALSRSIDALQ